jgi:hypothetical protein
MSKLYAVLSLMFRREQYFYTILKSSGIPL